MSIQRSFDRISAIALILLAQVINSTSLAFEYPPTINLTPDPEVVELVKQYGLENYTVTAVSHPLPPLLMPDADEDGGARGTGVDPVIALTKLTGLKLDYTLVPDARKFAMLKNGTADIVGTLLSPEYQQYLEPISFGKNQLCTTIPIMIYATKNIEINPNPTQWNNLRIATFQGWNFGPDMEIIFNKPDINLMLLFPQKIPGTSKIHF